MIQKLQGFPDIVVCSGGIEDAHAEDLFPVQLGSEDAGIAVFQDLFRDSAVQLIFLCLRKPGRAVAEIDHRELSGGNDLDSRVFSYDAFRIFRAFDAMGDIVAYLLCSHDLQSQPQFYAAGAARPPSQGW